MNENIVEKIEESSSPLQNGISLNSNDANDDDYQTESSNLTQNNLTKIEGSTDLPIGNPVVIDTSILCSNNETTTNSNSTNDYNSSETQSLNLTKLNFNVTPFEQLRKKVQEKTSRNRQTKLKYKRVKSKATNKKENKKKPCFKLCTNYEDRFYLTYADMQMCKNYKNEIVERNTKSPNKADVQTKKKRDPFFIALIDVLKTKYKVLNRRCHLNIWSKNVNKIGWTFYGSCIFKTCRTYKFKISSIRKDTGLNHADENMYQVEVFVDRLQTIIHDSKQKVGYVKGKYLIFILLLRDF